MADNPAVAGAAPPLLTSNKESAAQASIQEYEADLEWCKKSKPIAGKATTEDECIRNCQALILHGLTRSETITAFGFKNSPCKAAALSKLRANLWVWMLFLVPVFVVKF